MRQIWAVILAAGNGSRMATALGGKRKQYLEFDGRPLYWKSAETFSQIPDIHGLVFVFPPDEIQVQTEQVQKLAQSRALALPWRSVAGGKRRQDSVFSSLSSLPNACTDVLIHDAARPFFSAALVTRIVDALGQKNLGIIPAIPVRDTVKQINGQCVEKTLPREHLVAAQTPQGFPLPLLLQAHEQARQEGWQVTDDASMVERVKGAEVHMVQGEENNIKITTAEDLHLLQKNTQTVPVTGWGYDVHRYGGQRPLKIGSVDISGGYTVDAHSDGDVLLHALTDAILGTCGAGDIGLLFPDSDPKFLGMDSSIIVKEAQLLAEQAKVTICAVDLTIIAQVPKCAPYREQIVKNIALLLGLNRQQVNFKATTEEQLGFTGEKKGIKAVACVSALRTEKI